jgi:hypothetical protein
MSLRPGNAGERLALLVTNQAGEHVGFAVAQADRGVDLAIAERRQPAEAGAGNARDGDFQPERHVVVVVRPRRDVDVHADVLIVERRDRLLRLTAGCDRREGRHRDRDALAEARLRLHAVHRPQLRIGQRTRVGVGFEQAIVERRQAHEDDVALREIAQRAERDRAVRVGGDRGRAVDPGRPGRRGRRDLQAVLGEFRAIHFQQLDVDDHLGPRLVDRRQTRPAGHDPLRRVLDRHRVGAGRRRDAPGVETMRNRSCVSFRSALLR